MAADNKLYFANEDGEVFVVKAGPVYELLSKNVMGEVVMATPAITKNMIIIRGQNHVFAIASTKPGEKSKELSAKRQEHW
ncbi:MAG: hypothetical protein ACJ8LM_17495 [Candidatus Udaeobacter sp.]